MTSRANERRIAALEQQILGRPGEPKAVILVVGDEDKADQIRAAEGEHGADGVMVIHLVAGGHPHPQEVRNHA